MPKQNSKRPQKGEGRECRCQETDRAKNQAKKAEPTVRTLVSTLLLNVSSTTEPIQCHIGSVVELAFNRRVVKGTIPNTGQGYASWPKFKSWETDDVILSSTLPKQKSKRRQKGEGRECRCWESDSAKNRQKKLG